MGSVEAELRRHGAARRRQPPERLAEGGEGHGRPRRERRPLPLRGVRGRAAVIRGPRPFHVPAAPRLRRLLRTPPVRRGAHGPGVSRGGHPGVRGPEAPRHTGPGARRRPPRLDAPPRRGRRADGARDRRARPLLSRRHVARRRVVPPARRLPPLPCRSDRPGQNPAKTRSPRLGAARLRSPFLLHRGVPGVGSGPTRVRDDTALLPPRHRSGGALPGRGARGGRLQGHPAAPAGFTSTSPTAPETRGPPSRLPWCAPAAARRQSSPGTPASRGAASNTSLRRRRRSARTCGRSPPGCDHVYHPDFGSFSQKAVLPALVQASATTTWRLPRETPRPRFWEGLLLTHERLRAAETRRLRRDGHRGACEPCPPALRRGGYRSGARGRDHRLRGRPPASRPSRSRSAWRWTACSRAASRPARSGSSLLSRAEV